MGALIELRVEKARAMLESATDLRELAKVKNLAIGLEAYARAERAARESVVAAQEIQTRALRRTGELTLRLPKAKVRGSTSKAGKSRKVVEGPSKMEAVERAGLDRHTVHLAEKLARLELEKFETALARAKEDGVARPRSVVTASRAHVGHFTGNTEWGTPLDYLDDARYVLGGAIELDVASSEFFQRNVRALRFYTAEDSGLAVRHWEGMLFGNPPYRKDLIGLFVDKLIANVRSGHIKRAVWITSNGTETEWGQQLLSHSVSVCFPDERIQFLDQEGHKQPDPMQAHMVNYFGDVDGASLFLERFQKRGVCR